ncbi:MAG: hypothetical protein M3464_20145 [Chloroflexota bacterium]|nr:hypothetical protein [Chloroflexota bacterium]
MDATPRPRSDGRAPAPWAAIVLALVMLCSLAPPVAAVPAPPYFGPPPGFTSVDTNYVRIVIQDGAALDAAGFAVAYGPYLDRAYEEITTLFPAPPLRPELYVYSSPAALETAIAGKTMAAEVAIADPALGSGEIALALPRLQTLSPLEAENTLRQALARVVARRAAGGRLPPGFEAGIALYVERPVSARIARVAALLQNANRQNELPPWTILAEPAPAAVDPALVVAHAYGVVAFLVERYGLRRLNEFVTTLRHQPDWQVALRQVYDRAPAELEAEWRENLPQWTANGWQTNLFAAFDLQPARDLLASAHYAAAKAELGSSLRLFTELGDVARQTETEALMRQSDTGLQAESLMAQIQATLEAHSYPRARELIEQARSQFAQLPSTQRVDDLLAGYARIAAAGHQATVDLEIARRLAPVWTDYPEARAAALAAGVAAAGLGDQTATDQARAILDEIDSRQRRIVLLLVALAIMTFAWLGFWRWSRGPAGLDWR